MGDEDLRRRVEALLAAAEGDEGGLDRPAWDDASSGDEDPTSAVLLPGTRLGPYQIDGLAGQGGMGRVYRAIDLRLGRPVAIKVATRNFGGRFEREARAISALNHPHVRTLYDIG